MTPVRTINHWLHCKRQTVYTPYCTHAEEFENVKQMIEHGHIVHQKCFHGKDCTYDYEQFYYRIAINECRMLVKLHWISVRAGQQTVNAKNISEILIMFDHSSVTVMCDVEIKVSIAFVMPFFDSVSTFNYFLWKHFSKKITSYSTSNIYKSALRHQLIVI